MRLKKNEKICKFIHSIWFFPSVAALILIILTILQISGSSIGMYHNFFYGNQSDPELIFGHPVPIRSDEWMVNSQKIIAQKNNNFSPINQNFGNGEDATMLLNIPFNDWSIVFKPQNIAFFVLPLNNAFAFHWWVMIYLVFIGCYFFVLALMPNQKKLAIILSLGFMFSPFLHWWYVYSAMATTYCSLFGMTLFIKLTQSRQKSHRILWSVLLAYVATIFLFILYPPFQITCVIIMLSFAIGYTLNNREKIGMKVVKINLLFGIAAALIAVILAGMFLYQKKDVVTALQNSVYPGHRVVNSGSYSVAHLLSSDLSPVFQSQSRADMYTRPGSTSAINQSESSNFILLFPFLLPFLYYFSYKKYKRTKQIDFLVISISVALFCFLAWMFIPGLDLFGKLSLLERVPQARLLIGMGLINLICIILFVNKYAEHEKPVSLRIASMYSLSILVVYLAINVRVASVFPGFIGYKSAIAFSVVIPIIIFLMLRGYIKIAVVALLVFSFSSVCFINPLYRGMNILTDTQISKAIREIEPKSDKKWISEDIVLENFAAMNGRPSLTGVYVYPQLGLWDGLNQLDKQALYNRYAHTNFTFDRSSDGLKKAIITSPSADQLNIKISPCDDFFRKNNVGFLITSVKFESGTNKCAHFVKEVKYPNISFYIYELSL